MQEKTIVFDCGADGSVTPSMPVYAGVAGDELIANIQFNLNDIDLSVGNQNTRLARVDVADGMGGFWASAPLDITATTEDGAIEEQYVLFKLPQHATRAMGICRINLVISELNANCEEVRILYSATASLVFERSTNCTPSRGGYTRELSGMAGYFDKQTQDIEFKMRALHMRVDRAIDDVDEAVDAIGTVPEDKTVQGEIDELDDKKVDKIEGKGLSANDYTDEAVAEVAKIANKVDKIDGKGLSTNDYTDEAVAEVAKVANKVDKIEGKGLSTNDYTNEAVAEIAKIANKVDKVTGKGLSANDYTDADKAIVDAADVTYEKVTNKVTGIAQNATDEQYPSAKAVLTSVASAVTSLQALIANKVDKVTGKGLSTNDYTDEDKAQVATNKSDIEDIADTLGAVPDSKTVQGQIDDIKSKAVYEKGTFTAVCGDDSTNVQAAYYKIGDWCKVIIPVVLTAGSYSKTITGLPFASAETVSGVCASGRSGMESADAVFCDISKNNTTLIYSTPFAYTGNLTFEYPIATMIPTKIIDWDVNNNMSIMGTSVTKDGNGITLTTPASAGSRAINTWNNNLSTAKGITFTAKCDTAAALLKVQIGAKESNYYAMTSAGTTIEISLADLGVTPATGMDINFSCNTASAVITISDIIMY